MKTLKWMAMSLLALALTTTFYACGEDDEVKPNNEKGGQSTETVDHKDRLSQIGKELVSMIPPTDFDELTQLADDLRPYFDDDDQSEDVEEWAERCAKALISETLPDVTKEDSYSSFNHYTKIYKYTRRIYELSKFRAHLAWDELQQKWTVQEGTSDLQATCKVNGNTIKATLTYSGTPKKVYFGEISKGYEYDYSWWQDDDYNYHSSSTSTKDLERVYAMVPPVINITLTRDNETLVSIEVNTEFSMNSEFYDLTKDACAVTATVKLAGYEFKTVHATAKANQDNGVTATVNILKNGKKLVSAEVKGRANLSGSALVWNEDFDDDAFEDQIENASGSVSVANVDILGKLQIMASCSDIKQFVKYIEKADDARYEESKMKTYIQDANKLINVQFFYDGNGQRQGTFELEAFSRVGGRGTKYEAEPVVVFNDGSRYSLINETYFNEENFKSLIEKVEDLVERYEDYFEKYD